MQNTINKFILDKNFNNGLLLIDLPTGYGKTYMSIKSIYDCAVNSSTNKKIFFITTLTKNLPFKELKDIYEKNGLKNQFEKDILLIKSNYDFVHDNLLNLKIPEKYRKDSYYILKTNLEKIKKMEKENNPSQKDYVITLKEEVRNKFEKDFRNDIKAIIYKEMPFSAEERKRLIKNHKDYQWIGKLYPTVFMDEYKVYLLTMSKFLLRNTTLIEPSYEFVNHTISQNAIIFIDEFDATKATIQDMIMQNALDSQDDYIKLFQQIHKTMQMHHFPKDMLECTQSNQAESAFDILKKESNAIYDDYYLKYSYKTFPSGIDRKQNFLFNDSSYHTVFRNNNHYIRITPNQEKQQVQIFFENEEDYYKNKTNNDIIMYALIRTINNFIRKFKFMILNWAKKYAKEINHKRDSEEDIFTIENAKKTIYKEFSLSENQIKLLEGELCNNEMLNFERNQLIPDISFYNNGFKYFEFVDSDEHLSQTILNYVQVEDTPEKLILYLSKKSKVIGFSATATLDTVIGNYDIAYLKKELGESFFMIPAVVYESIRKDLEKVYKAYKDERVCVKVNAVNLNKSNVRLEKRLTEIVNGNDEGNRSKKDFIDGLKLQLMKNDTSDENSNGYIWKRYCNIFYVMKEFLLNENIKSLLCLNMLLPKENDSKFDLNLFHNVLEKLMKIFEIKDVDNIEIKVLKSDNFEDSKEEILKKLSDGKKIFIMSTYKTIGAGQNLQYNIPKKERYINIYDTKLKNDSRMNTKDIDAIFLGEITHLITNTYDEKAFKRKEMIKFFFEIEYLYENNEINYNTLNRLIKLGFKKYSNSHEEDKPAVSSLKNTESVLRQATRDVVQAVGRMCRTYNKKSEIHIFTVEELITKIDIKCLENRLLSPEMEAIIEMKNKMCRPYSPQQEKELNEAERKSSIGKNYIMRILSRDWTDTSISLWKNLRNCVLQYPTVSLNDMLKEENKEFISIIKTFYIKNIGENSHYRFAQKGDFSDVIIDFYNDTAKFLQRCKNKNISEVSEKESRLQLILKYAGMKKYFEENNWATSFLNKDFILSPILFQNIYKGALGEAAGKFILEKELGIQLMEITEPDKFEFFDFKISENVYIDFKHWKLGYLEDREKKKKEIRNKLDLINGKKVYIINIIAENTYKKHEQNDNRIIEIPNLIDSEGKVNTQMIKFLRGDIICNDIK